MYRRKSKFNQICFCLFIKISKPGDGGLGEVILSQAVLDCFNVCNKIFIGYLKKKFSLLRSEPWVDFCLIVFCVYFAQKAADRSHRIISMSIKWLPLRKVSARNQIGTTKQRCKYHTRLWRTVCNLDHTLPFINQFVRSIVTKRLQLMIGLFLGVLIHINAFVSESKVGHSEDWVRPSKRYNQCW